MVVVLLDRDGVINEDRSDYVTAWEHFRFLPSVFAALAELQSASIKLAVVTNQSAVGRGLMSAEALDRIHARMTRELAAGGVRLDGIFCCTHTPWDGCACRKPRPGLIERALSTLGETPDAAVMVGDGVEDLLAARAAGVPFVLVRGGRGEETLRRVDGRRPLAVVDSLPDAARLIVARLAPAPEALAETG